MSTKFPYKGRILMIGYGSVGRCTMPLIARHFDISWPAVSQNLAVLRASGAVVERRDGTRRFYRTDQHRLGPLAEVVRAMWTERLDVLADLAEQAERGIA